MNRLIWTIHIAVCIIFGVINAELYFRDHTYISLFATGMLAASGLYGFVKLLEGDN